MDELIGDQAASRQMELDVHARGSSAVERK
jgi:hypothetical protein